VISKVSWSKKLPKCAQIVGPMVTARGHIKEGPGGKHPSRGASAVRCIADLTVDRGRAISHIGYREIVVMRGENPRNVKSQNIIWDKHWVMARGRMQVKESSSRELR
jgi:hypothetical protein